MLRKALRKYRRFTYKQGRILGDIDAYTQGPVPALKRILRKRAYRKTNTGLRKVLKKLRLF